MARKALLIGINKHEVPGGDLRGCVNDVKNMKAMLIKYYDFPKSRIKTLTDKRAKQKAMQQGIKSLLRGAKKGDVLLLHYSGHGANVPDELPNRDEDDGFDEILCPTDLDWFDPLTDDWLRKQFDKVPKGVNFTVIMDCCHSGSNTRALPSPYSKDPIARYLASPWEIARSESRRKPRKKRGRKRRNRTNVATPNIGEILISGCRDDQTSADAWIGGSFQGAMSSSLLRAVKAKRGKLTYRELHKEILKNLRKGRFSQRSQLEGRKANLDRPFLAPF